MSLNDLKISKKLAFGFAVVVAVVAIMCCTVFISLGSIKTAVADNDSEVAQLNASGEIISALVERQNAVRGFVASGDESFIERIAADKAAYQTALSTLAKLAPEDAEVVGKVKAAADIANAEEDTQIVEARDPAKRSQAQATIAKTGRLTDTRAALKSFNDQETGLLKERAAQQAKTQAQATLMLVAGGVVAMLLSALMGWLLSRAIAGPISKMTDAMGKLASGDHAVDVPAVGRKDEVGQMADAVQTFKDAAIEKVRLEAEAAAQRREVEEQRKAAEAERAATAQQQNQVVDGLARGLERLAGGVLTFRLNEAFAPSYEKLRADFNAAMEQMQRTIAEVATNSSGVRTASTEISQASDNLSRRTEQQAASLEETAAALDEITATVRKTAEG
ncbi:MAG TPA: HAMP domain-containing protein, partial [Phenylobacterium sp.]|nr:HAMP domain-containing protein [Phenylobacterium sp.]